MFHSQQRGRTLFAVEQGGGDCVPGHPLSGRAATARPTGLPQAFAQFEITDWTVIEHDRPALCQWSWCAGAAVGPPAPGRTADVLWRRPGDR
ncbi:hypothetical protein ACFC00_03405 [Streptomyces adustus]|uniref:hypothetical protein n=1 Tax=Streptomyces adustus TaxID=1609272 RepID=UPI0035DD54D9